MKEIKSCPISEAKCPFKRNHKCKISINPNECPRCTTFRKHQRKSTLKRLKRTPIIIELLN